jgi:hypothetical protein
MGVYCFGIICVFDGGDLPLAFAGGASADPSVSLRLGLFDSHSLLPVVLMLAATSWMGLAILVVGRRKLSQLRFVEEKEPPRLPIEFECSSVQILLTINRSGGWM